MSPSVPAAFQVRPIRCTDCQQHVVWRGDTKCDPDRRRVFMIPGKKGQPQIMLIREDGRPKRGLQVHVSTPNSQAVEGYDPHKCPGKLA